MQLIYNNNMPTEKYYVVWKGYAPGVYDSWEEAELQVSGFPDAQYRSYKSQEDAVQAFRDGFDKNGLIQEVKKQVAQLNKEGHKIVWNPEKSNSSENKPTDKNKTSDKNNPEKPQQPKPKDVVKVPAFIRRALAVDGACEGNPGLGEYRGVYIETGEQVFHFGPVKGATNNIMEYLAIVHALAFLEKQNIVIPIYSDSVSAISWVRKGKANTTILPDETNQEVMTLIDRANLWLKTHSFRVNIIKWDTKAWGEIPADFGRKR